MDKFYDFDSCEESLKQFGGSDIKESIFFNGKRYMLKFNDFIPEDKRNEYTSSSRNNAFSEYISCHIIESLNIPVQSTLLGTRKGHIVVACEEFCVDGYDINEFEKNSSLAGIDFANTRYPELDDVIGFIRNDKRVDSVLAEKRFWDTFVIDALLGNFDRHTGNWGYLYNDDVRKMVLAPIYDCGACLYPMLSDDGMMNVLRHPEEVDVRIYNYPKAAFTYMGEKISYHEFLHNDEILTKYPLMRESIFEITEKISLNDIFSIINNTPNLSETRIVFYQTMIKERYDKILIPAVEYGRNHLVEQSQAPHVNASRKVNKK
jgi:hypothetical protein